RDGAQCSRGLDGAREPSGEERAERGAARAFARSTSEDGAHAAHERGRLGAIDAADGVGPRGAVRGQRQRLPHATDGLECLAQALPRRLVQLVALSDRAEQLLLRVENAANLAVSERL